MARTYKDRDALDLPREPEWARAQPQIRGPKEAGADWREEFYDELYRRTPKERER